MSSYPGPTSGSHKGGAWKVAYADFVTAMMALFIVLWLLNSSTKVRRNVTQYFKDPKGTAAHSGGQGGGAAASDNAGPARTDSTSNRARQSGGSATDIALNKDNIQQLQSRLEQAFKALPEFEFVKKHIRVTVTGEGLRIELLESEAGMFFDSGSPSPSPAGRHLLELLARELQRLPNTVIVEGHTDARPYRNENITGYSNWNLSLDRADAARRAMEGYGLRPDQVVQIRGFSDRKPLFKENAVDSQNRRVSVTVVYWSDEVASSKRP